MVLFFYLMLYLSIMVGIEAAIVTMSGRYLKKQAKDQHREKRWKEPVSDNITELMH